MAHRMKGVLEFTVSGTEYRVLPRLLLFVGNVSRNMHYSDKRCYCRSTNKLLLESWYQHCSVGRAAQHCTITTVVIVMECNKDVF